MKTVEKLQTMEVTHDERELIEILRNYRSARPNGTKWMDLDIQELVLRLKGFN